MKERPILFSAPMVRAILDGRKTQTRRVVKGDVPANATAFTTYHHPNDEDMQRPYWWAFGEGALLDFAVPCPYGKAGDRLWVRENYWAVELEGHGIGNQFIVYDEEWSRGPQGGGNPKPGEIRPMLEFKKFGHHPSIHMPRWASRITLEITGVRVERLQDISENDIVAEGATVDRVAKACNVPWSDMPTLHHAWQVLWETINGAESWAANPWVWVVEFKRIEQMRAAA